jgi:hypothetical protein
MYWGNVRDVLNRVHVEKLRNLSLIPNKVKCSKVLQCSDGLSNKVPNIIRRLMDNMKLLFICILL